MAETLGANAPGDEAVFSFADAPVCPADAVPIVAIADFHRRRGVRVSFDCPDGSAPSHVFAGFISGSLSPSAAGTGCQPCQGSEFCSSAFIDELVGKLLAKYGFLAFTQRVRLLNVQGLSASLVNHSMSQRLAKN